MRRAAAVNSVWDRDDSPIVRRWAKDELHISEFAKAVRHGDFQKLRRLNTEGVRLGDMVQRYLQRSSGTRAAIHTSVLEQLVAELGADFVMHTLTRKQAEAS